MSSNIVMAAITTPDVIKKRSKSSSGANSNAKLSAALEAVGARPRRTQRRPTKQASYELCNHAKAYLEGGQFASGYDFLYSLLAAGTSISTPAQPYIGFLSPPAYLAFASSLIAYPKITTKTNSKEVRKGSDAALRYLRCVHTTIDGPAYSAIRQAFRFPEEQSRRRAPAHRSVAASLSPGPGDDVELIAGEAANAGSIWTRAEDFWQLVGWAFNCSVSHKKRWDRWKLWLGVMLNFLEADWEFCVKGSKAEETSTESILQESLLWHYIVGQSRSVNRGSRRRIVKAILATASVESLKDYPQIWDKETEGPKRKKKDHEQFGEVDFETGDMAGYDSDDDMQDAPDETSNDKLSEDPPDGGNYDGSLGDVHDAVEQFGGMHAVALRHRLIALLAQVARYLPNEFTTPSDFFDTILEDFIRLPIRTFQVLLSTFKLAGQLRVAFCANLLLPLVSGKLPDYFGHEPTQQQFESTLLMLRGTTQSFAANAKISLILEQMVMYMMTQNELKATKTLRAAMEGGIKARQSVYGTGKGKRGNAEEEAQSKIMLEACSERLLGMLEVLEIKEGNPPQLLKVNANGSSEFLSFGSGSSLSEAPESDTDEEN